MANISKEEWQSCLGMSDGKGCKLIEKLYWKTDHIQKGKKGWRKNLDEVRQEVDAVRRNCHAHNSVNGLEQRTERIDLILEFPCIELMLQINEKLGGFYTGYVYTKRV